MDNIIKFLAYKVVKVSGLFWLLCLILTSLATGQAELSYKYHWYGNIASLFILISARIEGHWDDIKAWIKQKLGRNDE